MILRIRVAGSNGADVKTGLVTEDLLDSSTSAHTNLLLIPLGTLQRLFTFLL